MIFLNRSKKIRILAAIFLIMPLLLLEVGSFALLKFKKKQVQPLFISLSRKSAIASLGYGIPYQNVDPHLGYAPVPPFVTYGEDKADAIRIFALGGSTTDPILQPNNWASHFPKNCLEHQLSCVVLNGGVGGYTSSQELLKLIRDTQPLKPDIVVSLSGINDAMGARKLAASESGSSMIHSYQGFLMNYLAKPQFQVWGLFPNLQYILRAGLAQLNRKLNNHQAGISFGIKDGFLPVELWERNVRIMHAISQEFGFQYLVVLQPAIGVGKYHLSDHERDMREKGKKLFGSKYFSELESFYEVAKTICGHLDYCFDFSSGFDALQNLYADLRHPNEKGHLIESEAIFNYLISHEMLKKASVK